MDGLEQSCAKFAKALGKDERGEGMNVEQIRKANAMLEYLERMWRQEDGLPERPWFRNWYGANDPDSGYAAWGLPALRWAVEHNERVRQIQAVYEEVIDNMRESIEEAAEKIGG
ncbi:MAG TPA: transferrin receptor-like dimerization domain-containing protein [Phycisphaerales bacterium]|nr:transferrin receptor-like dimerization domain-containing protein [Phycisphaerales bacterium]